VVGGCATPPSDPAALAAYEQANDPLEPLNRGTFEFNRVVDGLLIKNIAMLYRTVFPDEVRTGIRNILHNLNEPVVFANNMLQGEFDRAGTTALRFGINTTVGIGGTFDWATKWGHPQQTGDFGQTLWSWGVPEGPYIVLPLLGPSDPRDAFGEGVDGYIDPFRYLARDHHITEANTVRFITDGIDRRAESIDELNEIEKNSVDYYAQIRSLWRQMRAQQLNGVPTDSLMPSSVDNTLYEDPGKAQSPAPKTQ
jgi:phospholipid-binding lipoprotein MlaA